MGLRDRLLAGDASDEEVADIFDMGTLVDLSNANNTVFADSQL
jgi:hypothetical protein